MASSVTEYDCEGKLMTIPELNDAIGAICSKNGLNTSLVQRLHKYILQCSKSENLVEESVIEDWLTWCQHNNYVICTSIPIPGSILPDHISGSVIDIKVNSKRAPDDKIYYANQDIREKVARGSTVLCLIEQGRKSLKSGIFALRKFTGGMGDEDTDQPEDSQTWHKYFLKPLDETKELVCTMKVNGEAAHLSVHFIHNSYYFMIGSKNVHMFVRTREDIERHGEGRYQFARTISHAVFDMLDEMTPEKRNIFLSFLCHTNFTCVFELLQPDNQHIVNLSNLEKPVLYFIAFCSPFGSNNNVKSYCSFPPNTAIDFVKSLGVTAIDYEVVPAKNAEKRMDIVRQGYGYEGEVLYFMDEEDNVIGLLKKKTIWYVLCRSIREKICQAYSAKTNGKAIFNIDKHFKKISDRISAIQQWLNLSESVKQNWIQLGQNFLHWIVQLSEKDGELPVHVRSGFPVLWEKFLSETDQSDRI